MKKKSIQFCYIIYNSKYHNEFKSENVEKGLGLLTDYDFFNIVEKYGGIFYVKHDENTEYSFEIDSIQYTPKTGWLVSLCFLAVVDNIKNNETKHN